MEKEYKIFNTDEVTSMDGATQSEAIENRMNQMYADGWEYLETLFGMDCGAYMIFRKMPIKFTKEE